MASLVATSQAEVVVLAVDRDVFVVPLRELLDRSLNRLDTALFTHLLRRVVGVAAGAVPVALEWLRVERNLDAPLLGDADEEIASHPEVVTHGDTLTWANLELPLGGHDLGVDAGDVDACVEARAVVRLDEVTGEDLASTWLSRRQISTCVIMSRAASGGGEVR